MKPQATAISIIAAGVLISGALLFGGGRAPAPAVQGGGAKAPTTVARGSTAAEITSVPEGAQVITVNAKGGYSPSSQVAKAGVPTVLKVETSGTYDCSTALRVPSIGFAKRLPSTGTTLISLGTPTAGTVQGTCSMGMYSFDIQFS